MNITYDINQGDIAPSPGEYLVSVSKKHRVGSVYLVQTIRPVKQKVISEFDRYALTVMSMPELKDYTVLDEKEYNVWVRGEPAHYIIWYPRKAK